MAEVVQSDPTRISEAEVAQEPPGIAISMAALLALTAAASSLSWGSVGVANCMGNCRRHDVGGGFGASLVLAIAVMTGCVAVVALATGARMRLDLVQWGAGATLLLTLVTAVVALASAPAPPFGGLPIQVSREPGAAPIICSALSLVVLVLASLMKRDRQTATHEAVPRGDADPVVGAWPVPSSEGDAGSGT